MNSEAVFSAGPAASFPERGVVSSLMRTAIMKYQLRRQVAAERKQLAELPESLLKDIGVKREDALRESRRDPGDLPQDRLAKLV